MPATALLSLFVFLWPVTLPACCLALWVLIVGGRARRNPPLLAGALPAAGLLALSTLRPILWLLDLFSAGAADNPSGPQTSAALAAGALLALAIGWRAWREPVPAGEPINQQA